MLRRDRERGATLLDAIVGTALMTLVFVGIVGAFRLTVDAVMNNKARAGAIALANERLEYVRSLAYTSIGTVGGIPSGTIPQTENTVVNDVTYTRRTFIDYEDDPNDGTGASDSNGVTADYKAAKVSVSWTDRGRTRTITLVTRVSPVGIESAVPGGTLSILVVNASSTPISGATVSIVNSGVSPAVNLTTYSDDTGRVSLIGVPAGAGYQVTATKTGYSTAQTYSATAQNTNPSPAHLGVSNNQTTAATFAIDLTGTKTIQTFLPIARATSTETFSTEAIVASSTNIAVQGGVVRLTGSEPYSSPGMFLSTVISTSTISRWNTFTWVATKPASTNVLFQFYDANGLTLIPDAQIPGNSTGLTTSPVSLENVSTTTHAALTILATLTTTNASNTPSIDSWAISNDSGPVLLPNVSLSLTGAKTIGTGPSGLVYKYATTTLSSGALGSLTLSNIEWDAYTVGVNGTTHSIASACGPQPESLYPGMSVTTQLTLAPYTAHSLLVDVKNASGAVIPGANVRVYRTASPASDTTIASDGCGNSFFSGMNAGTGASAYSVQVSASGYTTYTASNVNVSGTSRLSVILN